ncbi:small multi-drug export protein [Salicibibacter kimchii]|uniref:DNA-binding protein n=1 Tax=Salicibibacter kimchii TaxID=2099786 RepID=A0A345BZS5_9BACI|nr:small multi-drug export protein [Salicibibacter kimchii]AXF56456.1 hypothetical protein DT065_10765 [Salicibibacter kimchii]
MDHLIYFIIIFLGAAIPFIEYMTVIPLGVIIGLPLLPTIVLGFAGNLVTVLLVIFLVDKIREFLQRRKKQNARLPATEKGSTSSSNIDQESNNKTEATATTEVAWEESFTSKRRERAQKLWDKYGLPGLAVLGTGLLSSHLTAMMACTFGANRTYIIIWMAISLALWSILIGIAFQLGMDAIFR